MLRTMRILNRKVCLAFAAMLAAAIATSASATDATAATLAADAAPQPLQQLEEIWVHGKRLSRRIVDSEDDFFQLYNKLNEDHDYDIRCGNMSLSRGSMIMIRRCVPEFMVDYMENYGRNAEMEYGAPSFDGSPSFPDRESRSFGGCREVPPQQNSESGADYDAPCYFSRSVQYAVPVAITRPTAPPVTVVLQQRSQAYTNNVLQVINSNPQLLQKYTHLVGLYDEMRQAQSQYAAMQADRAKERQPAPPNLGPRLQ